MLGIVIKNNLKLMLRDKIVIILMLLGPILVTAALSSGFSSLMSKYELSDNVKVGFTCTDSSTNQLIDQIRDTAKNNGIEFKQYETDDYQAALSSDAFDVFISFDQNSYTIYQDKDHKMEASTVGYFLTTFYQTVVDQAMNNVNANPYQAPAVSVDNQVDYQREVIHKTPTADSSDYYGIIEIVYFLWCGSLALGAVISSERKNHIQTRFNLSVMSRFSLFLGKAIPCILAITLESAASAVICSLLFNVHWGNILGSAVILILGATASTSFGILLFYLFQNTVLPVISIFSLSWVFGFIGGTFESYMYSSYPEIVKQCSPIYLMNRTLVEYTTTGSSSYTIPTIIYLCIFTVVCSLIGILLMHKRMEEN